MTIKYHWEDVTLNIPDMCSQGFTPHTHPLKSDVDYSYDVDIDFDDVIDYLIPYSLAHKINKTRDEIMEVQTAKAYMRKVLDFLFENDAIDREELESDEDFKEFLHDKYEDKAWEEFQSTNEEY